MDSLIDYLKKIDWPLLGRQVQTLVDLQMQQDKKSSEWEHLGGVISLLDDLQDEAARQDLIN